jgi:hypothetical protein
VLFGFGTYARRFSDLTRDFAQLSRKIGAFRIGGNTNSATLFSSPPATCANMASTWCRLPTMAPAAAEDHRGPGKDEPPRDCQRGGLGSGKGTALEFREAVDASGRHAARQ